MKKKSLIYNITVNGTVNNDSVDNIPASYQVKRSERGYLIINVFLAKAMPYDTLKQYLIGIAKRLQKGGKIVDYDAYISDVQVDFTVDDNVWRGKFTMQYVDEF